MRINLHEDPSVIGIASDLGIDEFSVVGRLHRLWGWANANLIDGQAPNISSAWLDRAVQLEGFAGAMERHGWLISESQGQRGVSFPKFTEWNGKSAKSRLLNTRRKKQGRTDVPFGSGQKEDNSETTEEKRREEKKKKNIPPVVPPGGGTDHKSGQKSKRCPEDLELTPQRLKFAEGEGLETADALREWQRMQDHQFRNAHSDWDAVWRNWVRTAVDRSGKNGRARGSPVTAGQRGAENIRQFLQED